MACATLCKDIGGDQWVLVVIGYYPDGAVHRHHAAVAWSRFGKTTHTLASYPWQRLVEYRTSTIPSRVILGQLDLLYLRQLGEPPREEDQKGDALSKSARPKLIRALSLSTAAIMKHKGLCGPLARANAVQ